MMISGGRFGKTVVPSSIDILQARARLIPGPGQYKVDDAYEHSTFCNKVKLEEEIRSRRDAARNGNRAATSMGAHRPSLGT